MADEQDRWLDRETAEILLRGEPLEAVDPVVRQRAERLAGTLDALAAHPARTGGELPGEAAALAAFRTARADRAQVPAGAPARSGRLGSDAGLVRLGTRGDGARRPRWGRSLRLGLAAALTAGMVGGVAVAAGTGVLPTPFGGDGPDAPAASVSAAATPDSTLKSPTPLDGSGEGTGPDGATPGPSARSAAPGATSGEHAPDAGGRAAGASGERRRELTASCRDMSTGKPIDGVRRRALTQAAGGDARVAAYCQNVLAAADSAARARTGGGTGGPAADDGRGRTAPGRESGQAADDRGDEAGTPGDAKGDGRDENGDRGDGGQDGGRKQGEGAQGEGAQGEGARGEGDTARGPASRAQGTTAPRPARATETPPPPPDRRPGSAPQQPPAHTKAP
ncbi:hypothetical protein [Streptomyces sp. NPDC047725]|uniref:hypothetical protein n=1 Tax=Streptomyces sp. NPDC047725 TaxID=3365487 RepID=UPI003715C0F3